MKNTATSEEVELNTWSFYLHDWTFISSPNYSLATKDLVKKIEDCNLERFALTSATTGRTLHFHLKHAALCGRGPEVMFWVFECTHPDYFHFKVIIYRDKEIVSADRAF